MRGQVKPILLGDLMKQELEVLISHNQLLSILNYDKNTGIFTWKQNRGKARIGNVAGSVNSKGYGVIFTHARMYKMHRLAWFYVTNEWPIETIDHINGVKADNRFINLREATVTENARNKPISKSNTSGYKGVIWNKQSSKWQARAKIGCKNIYLGFFDNKEDAANAYQTYVKELHGEYFAGEDRITSIKK